MGQFRVFTYLYLKITLGMHIYFRLNRNGLPKTGSTINDQHQIPELCQNLHGWISIESKWKKQFGADLFN